MEPLITVIISIYNMEAYLARCLDSVLNNTYRSLEIICVDDGSQDGSAEILRAYAEKDSRIVPIFKENGGVSSARNAGLDRMTGEYVTFIDPDDFVHPQYFELLYRALEESGTPFSICNYQIVYENATLGFQDRIEFEPDSVRVYAFTRVFKKSTLGGYIWAKMFRSELTKEIRFHEDLQIGEDSVFVSEVCENAETRSAAYIDQPLYLYFQREGSIIRTAGVLQYYRFAETMTQKLVQAGAREEIYLDRAIKVSLFVRYLSSHFYPDRKAVRKSNALLRLLRKKAWKTRIYEPKEKAVFLAFIFFPELYWLYRTKKDPNMWAWEKVERKKRRAVKKKSQTGRV